MKTIYKVTVTILVLLVVGVMGYVYYRHYTSPVRPTEVGVATTQ
jgi:hypothetical protein